MNTQIDMIQFLFQLGSGVLVTFALYSAAYFSSSYFFFNSQHGSIVEWKKYGLEFAIAVDTSLITYNDTMQTVKINRIISDEMKNQIVRVSISANLIHRAEQRMRLYKSRDRFMIFGVLLALCVSLVNSLPLLFIGAPLVDNILAYSGTITTFFGTFFIIKFNWLQTIEWNKLKEDVEINKKEVECYGF